MKCKYTGREIISPLDEPEGEIEVGKTYLTHDGRSVDVLKIHDRMNAAAWLLDDMTLCWYSISGKCQMWDAEEKDHIEFPNL